MRFTLVGVAAIALALTPCLGCGDRPAPPPAAPSTADAAGDASRAAPADAPAVAPGEAEAREKATDDGPDDARVEIPAVEPIEPPPAPPGFMPTPPAFDALPLTARLPADAAGLLVLGSPADLARRIGWGDLIDALGPEVARDRAEAKALLGHDLLDPGAWAAAGIDPAQPLGIAVLRVQPALVAVAVAVKDAEALAGTLRASPLFELTAVVEGELTLLHDARHAFALKGDEAWVVLGDRVEPGETLHHARALAARPEATLLARDKVGSVVARLNYGRDVAAIVNLPAIFDAALRESMGTAPHSRLERRLRGAEALGQSERVAELRAELEQRRVADPAWGGGKVAAGMVLRSYLTPFGGLALGLNVERDAVQLRFTHDLDRDAPVGRLFASRTGPLALRAAFARPPAGLVELNVDPAALGELTRALSVALFGGVLGMLDKELRAVAGHDLDGLLKLLAGDLGAAAEVDPTRLAGVRHPEELLTRARFAAHVGLTDPRGAGALFARLATRPEVGLVSVVSPADGPRFWRLGLSPTTTLWLAIADHQLFASLDESTIRRLAGQVEGDPGAGFVADLPAAARAMLDGRDGGWSGWLDIGGLGPLMMNRAPQVVREAPTGDDPAAKLRAEIAALDAQIEAHHRAHRQTQVKRGRQLLAALGRLAASVQPTADGLDGRAGLYPGPGGVRAALLAMAREARASEVESRTLWNAQVQPLREKQRALQTQLEALEVRAAPER